jgi:sulfite reductase (ferredoxin)
MSQQTTVAAPVPPASSPEAAPKHSAVEGIKEASRQLRGTIGEELQKDSDHFSEQDKQLLKFHGSYQQEDRDARKNRKKEGVGKHYLFMVRCKIPGGRLTAKQYLAVDDLAGAHANGTLRFTTRQGIQLHGVLKSDLKQTIAGINACLLSTLGACGDVERNVMACPAPHYDGVHAQLQETAAILAAHLAPRSLAYHEIWLNGQPVGEPDAVPDLEPLYGKVYLPRKFKTGLALPEDNCIDIHAQDLGLLAIVENGTIVGYNLLVGGGMGMTHGNANTFPHLARPICYVPAGAVVGAAEAVVRLFRDQGNRADRKRARIKYLVHDWGVEKFREVLSGYIGGTLQPARPVQVHGFEPHLGWQPQGDGKWYFGLSIENGRVKDEGRLRLRTGLRKIIERFQPALRLTPLQDILLCDLDAGARAEIESILEEHGIPRPDQISNVQKYSMACPAIPTCGLAISESERALPGIIDELEAELKRLGLEQEKLSVRMTGCPNGCARPYQSDIGIVGRSGDKFTLFVGGHVLGHRLNFQLKDLVHRDELLPTLVPLLEHFRTERQTGESFGDYCHRLGQEKLLALLPKPPEVVKALPEEKTNNGAGHSRLEEFLAKGHNGHAHPVRHGLAGEAEGAALGEPATRAIPLTLADPVVLPKSVVDPAGLKRSEHFLSGPCGEELRDYSFRYGSAGQVVATVVYFYGEDLRAGAAHAGLPLRRKAVYHGQVDPQRLHAARKLFDTHYVGPAGHERADYRVHYHADGQVARTVVYFYANAERAEQAPSRSAVRRQVAYEGKLS